MNLAVFFTASRIIVAPIFAFLFIHGFRTESPLLVWGAVVCAILIELSDMFDGMIARGRKEVTDFGKVFDPVADSLSRLTVFASFLATGIIPIWVFLVFLYRDVLMQLMRILCATNGIVLAARKSGKIKAILQAIATFIVLAIVLAHLYTILWMPRTVWGMHTAFWAVLGAALYTAVSGFDYIFAHRDVIRKMLQPKNT